eukprot:914046-Pelagomonas_calceolata.AAC.6
MLKFTKRRANKKSEASKLSRVSVHVGMIWDELLVAGKAQQSNSTLHNELCQTPVKCHKQEAGKGAGNKTTACHPSQTVHGKKAPCWTYSDAHEPEDAYGLRLSSWMPRPNVSSHILIHRSRGTQNLAAATASPWTLSG